MLGPLKTNYYNKNGGDTMGDRKEINFRTMIRVKQKIYTLNLVASRRRPTVYDRCCV